MVRKRLGLVGGGPAWLEERSEKGFEPACGILQRDGPKGVGAAHVAAGSRMRNGR